MSKKKNEKVTFFDELKIEAQQNVEEEYAKLSKKIYFQKISVGISFLGTVGSFIFTFTDLPDFIMNIVMLVMLLGIAVTVIFNFKMVLKTLLNCVKLGWKVVPFLIIDIFGAIIGLAVALYIIFYAPVIICCLSVYQSIKHKKEYDFYLASSKNQA